MSEAELLTSIDEYQTQLIQVEKTIALCTDPTQRDSLENLRKDLTELLDLTKEQLNELGSGQSTDPFEDEMKLFLSEIRSVEQSEDVAEDVDENFEARIETIKTQLTEIVGKKFLAPYNSWNGKAFHNAFVCSLDDTTDYDETVTLDNIKIKVLFINPTHRDMVPCSYFLDGSCKFDSDRCHYSHGELVLYKELQDYKEPNFQLLQQMKCPVLVKQSDRIWHRGRVTSSNFDEQRCTVKLEQNNKEICCEFPDVLPMHCDSPTSEDESSDSNSYGEERHKQILVDRTLLNPSTDGVLGEWEKHTKGFGSKMMQKFGYILGTGLGNNGEGIVDPVQIQILPAGKSLDYCMELRERANGDKDLFNVDRKWKKQQKKQELVNARAYERNRQSSNVFNFLNDSILATMDGGRDAVPTPQAQTQPKPVELKTHSTKNLNVAAFKLGEDIKKLEKDIQSVKDSMARQQRGTPVYSKLSAKLSSKHSELTELKKSEKNVTSEQIFRKDKSKLTIF
ncbi:zinc finger CCCH-type with G patch domain-containing protein [Bradysia coprophila]|uniref:zinc finger CCCH-type with G patch domain-containing protein n=1 Tax=Bradysia coprophila TaxID=38358 RepID=UPI00187D9F8C|nr:zinc finger CCCH-type with G patch domain-containing protein [Bradysia coprophila]